MHGEILFVGIVLIISPGIIVLLSAPGKLFNENNLYFPVAGILFATAGAAGMGMSMWFYCAALLAVIALLVARIQLRHYNSPLARAIREERRYEQRTLEQFRAEIDRFDEGGGMELV